MQQVPAALLDFINNGENFLVAGHKEPDGDCVGSQLALLSVLQRMGKKAAACSAGPFKRSEIKNYQHLFSSAPASDAAARVIIVDCSSIDRTGCLEPFIEKLPMAFIDHHEMGRLPDKENNGICYFDSKAPSTTFLILKLILALGMEPSQEEAKLLFFGLCTDTGFFRHLDRESGETFTAASVLVHYGANPKAAFASIYGGKTLDSRKFLGNILLRSESLFGGQLIISSEENEEIRNFGIESRDSDSLYQLLLTIEGAEAIVIFRQETPEKCSVGLRSRDWVDVGSIALSFGGGGHKNASGFTVQGTIPELKSALIKVFNGIFNP